MTVFFDWYFAVLILGLYAWGIWEHRIGVRLKAEVTVLKAGLLTLQDLVRDYEEGTDIEIDFSLDEEDDE